MDLVTMRSPFSWFSFICGKIGNVNEQSGCAVCTLQQWKYFTVSMWSSTSFTVLKRNSFTRCVLNKTINTKTIIFFDLPQILSQMRIKDNFGSTPAKQDAYHFSIGSACNMSRLLKCLKVEREKFRFLVARNVLRSKNRHTWTLRCLPSLTARKSSLSFLQSRD